MGNSHLKFDHFVDDPKTVVGSSSDLVMDKPRLLRGIDKALEQKEISALRKAVGKLLSNAESPQSAKKGLSESKKKGMNIVFDKRVLGEELRQIQEAYTLERAQYYLKRLKKGITEVRTGKVNDINLNRWKGYKDILTDSLWLMDKRDASGEHLGWYWGNFIPQIPYQLMSRYTKKGDWVIDPFVGSGTTLIECRRLGRNGIGVELSKEVSKKAEALIGKEKNIHHVTTQVIAADSRTVNFKEILKECGIKKVQMIVMHPPYHDIIRFNEDPRDLSNAQSVDQFVKMFCEVFDNTVSCLEKGRYVGIVIGDKYSKGEWIPLGFKVMNEVLKRKFSLKSIVVKNFDETRGKRNQKELWKYRAIVGGFYIFKHEYILIFQKGKKD